MLRLSKSNIGNISIINFKNKINKRGTVVSDETIKWIGYLGLLAAASFAVWKIVAKVMG
jgi:hypothetical protein